MEYGRARKPITQAGLARLLHRYKIAPANMRANEGKPQKDYFLKSFKAAFERYLTLPTGLFAATPKQDQQDQEVGTDFDPLHKELCSGCKCAKFQGSQDM